jgi:hypothetical protein
MRPWMGRSWSGWISKEHLCDRSDKDDSGCFEEVKEEPKKDDKGKGKEKEKAPKGMDGWNEERKKAVAAFLKGQGF